MSRAWQSHIYRKYKDVCGLAQARGLPSLIYREPVLEVRFMCAAAGTTRILTIEVDNLLTTLDYIVQKVWVREVVEQREPCPGLRATPTCLSERRRFPLLLLKWICVSQPIAAAAVSSFSHASSE